MGIPDPDLQPSFDSPNVRQRFAPRMRKGPVGGPPKASAGVRQCQTKVGGGGCQEAESMARRRIKPTTPTRSDGDLMEAGPPMQERQQGAAKGSAQVQLETLYHYLEIDGADDHGEETFKASPGYQYQTEYEYDTIYFTAQSLVTHTSLITLENSPLLLNRKQQEEEAPSSSDAGPAYQYETTTAVLSGYSYDTIETEVTREQTLPLFQSSSYEQIDPSPSTTTSDEVIATTTTILDSALPRESRTTTLTETIQMVTKRNDLVEDYFVKPEEVDVDDDYPIKDGDYVYETYYRYETSTWAEGRPPPGAYSTEITFTSSYVTRLDHLPRLRPQPVAPAVTTVTSTVFLQGTSRHVTKLGYQHILNGDLRGQQPFPRATGRHRSPRIVVQ